MEGEIGEDLEGEGGGKRRMEESPRMGQLGVIILINGVAEEEEDGVGISSVVEVGV